MPSVDDGVVTGRVRYAKSPCELWRRVCKVTTDLAERGVHRSGGGVPHVGEDVAVNIEGETHVAMP